MSCESRPGLLCAEWHAQDLPNQGAKEGLTSYGFPGSVWISIPGVVVC